ncbi:MAG: hypothetical protein KJ018_22270, partial [Burkholderiales bacterium]|nr:hypothetical protein [Burkholderiales bacterium]
MLDGTRDRLTEAQCVDCGVTYGYDAAWWRGRSLQPPKRCRLCRQARRGEQDAASTGTRPRVRGVV